MKRGIYKQNHKKGTFKCILTVVFNIYLAT